MLLHDGPLLLPPDDPRCKQVARVATRLITALEEQDGHVVYGASWPPRDQVIKAVHDREEREDRLDRYKPSGTAKSSYMPFRPETHNPLKQLEAADWNIYVFDLVSDEYPERSLTCSPWSMHLLYRAKKSSYIPGCWTYCLVTTRC